MTFEEAYRVLDRMDLEKVRAMEEEAILAALEALKVMTTLFGVLHRSESFDHVHDKTGGLA